MIECVPNLSEGRDPAVVEEVTRSVERAGAQLLDVHRDPDHHRSVFTLAGEPSVVLEAVLALVTVAVRAIDIAAHRGEHPRIGTVDVVPFVPLRGSSLEACVAVAREAGSRIASLFGIPVFLYEAAASRADRVSLADVRRGGLPALARRIETSEGRPDFGPCRLHPRAGAVVVGARRFLVAYNVNLAGNDLEAAREIAAAVRASNGGLPGVRALGVRLASRGVVQVTMNLTDPSTTTVPAAFEAVRRAARRRGLSILESEVVGLAPRSAFGEATTESLLLTRPIEEIVLENRVPIR
jgi:glutamate formiminotransferase